MFREPLCRPERKDPSVLLGGLCLLNSEKLHIVTARIQGIKCWVGEILKFMRNEKKKDSYRCSQVHSELPRPTHSNSVGFPNLGHVTGNLIVIVSFSLSDPPFYTLLSECWLLSMTVRWQNKYWYIFPPLQQRFGGWRHCSQIAHLPSLYGTRPSVAKGRKKKKTNLVPRDVSILFVFQDFCSCKTCLPSGPHTASTRGLPRWCPVTTHSRGGHRARAPSAGKA